MEKVELELIEKTEEVARKNGLENVIELLEDGSLFVYSHYSNKFHCHNFYVIVTEDSKLAIEHSSDDSDVVLYTQDSNNKDFTPESVIETILATVKALEIADEAIENSPIKF